MTIAEKLGITDITSWVKNELNGYNTSWPDTDLPEYRKCRAILKGYNSQKGWMPIIFEGTDVDRLIHNITIYQPVAELEPLKNSPGYLECPLTGPQEFQIHKWIKDTPIMKRLIPNTAIDKIFNAVRNIILQWALTLEKQGITGKDMSFTPEEKKMAQTNQAVHIENFFGNFGDISNSQITQQFNSTIEKNNFESLSKYLSSKGINKEDIANLHEALNEDPCPTSPTQLGQKVSAWLGNMISKAASGAFSIGVDTITILLVTAINKYYGL
ncbi:hypothetical protein B0B39_10885 [Legionella longbeachae]|uniref:AbiTii domain-containing protein n=1 Tax=Legionella longbeachae TaxID=450 RepID=UPI000F73BC26|nr:hypothetical protein [Legionella longbeachae]ARM33999.2 hypothetical protein B0B39_10885 [Legionella longbeachae]